MNMNSVFGIYRRYEKFITDIWSMNISWVMKSAIFYGAYKALSIDLNLKLDLLDQADDILFLYYLSVKRDQLENTNGN